MRIEEQLQCNGLMGLGTGYTLGKANTPWTQTISGKDSYCAGCPLTRECWARHRAKVQLMMPRASKMFDEMQEKYGQETAMRLWQGWARDNNKRNPIMAQKMPESDPYWLQMQANIEDGYAIGQNGKPKDRGPFTLRWPRENI